MKRAPHIRALLRRAGLTAALWLVQPHAFAGAAEAAAPWRSTYDTVMMWVNFLILVALLYKLLRKPLRGFLRGQRDAIAAEIERLAEQKARLEADIAAFHETLADRRVRFEDVYRRIIEDGERERQELIETARRQAAIMIESARQRVDNQFRKAAATFRSELIDAAMDIVAVEIPRHVSEENNRRWVQRFIRDIDESSI